MCSYLFAVDFNVCDVVLKHCGNIDLWKLVLAEHNEQTGLPAGSVSYYDQLFPYRCHDCRQGAVSRPKGTQVYVLQTFYLREQRGPLQQTLCNAEHDPAPGALFSCVDKTPKTSHATNEDEPITFFKIKSL